MPTPGLSLVGFISDQQTALNHLQNVCVPANNDQAVLVAEWTAAKARLGGRVVNAGDPTRQPLPAAQQAHAQQVLSHPVLRIPREAGH